jgi:hypothetical protein
MAGAPFTMDVEVGKVREFARATKSSNPDQLAGEHPTSPPTFLISAAFWTEPENAPEVPELDVARLLHGGQEFTFHGPPPKAGTRLVGTARLDKTYTKEGRRGGAMTFIETVTEFRDEAGAMVAESRTILITTGKAPAREG